MCEESTRLRVGRGLCEWLEKEAGLLQRAVLTPHRVAVHVRKSSAKALKGTSISTLYFWPPLVPCRQHSRQAQWSSQCEQAAQPAAGAQQPW